MKRIPLSEPTFNGNEWNYIKECLDTGWVSSAGRFVNLFEEKICEYTGAKHAVAVMNGTAAIHLALRLFDIGPGDEVIVPTLTFIAPINCVDYVGAEPVFMDCDEYYNIDVNKVIEFLEEETITLEAESANGQENICINKKTGKRIAAIIPVHIFGNACNLDRLIPECRKRNIKVIEDATESLGTYYTKGEFTNRYTGTIGDIGCYSFNGNKIITTGGGGMLVTNNKELAEKSRYLSTQAKDDIVNYIHNEVGYNYRMTNIQAALGVAQIEQLDSFILRKKKNYQYYQEILKDNHNFQLAEIPEYAEQNYWLYALQIKNYNLNKSGVITNLMEGGIDARPVWHLNHNQKMYKEYQISKIEIAELLFNITINIPSSAKLTKTDIEQVVRSL